MENNCVVCEHSLRRRHRHILNAQFLLSRPDFREHIDQAVPFNGTRSMCNSCWHLINHRIARQAGEAVPAHNIEAHNHCVSCQHRILQGRQRHVLNSNILEVQRNIAEYILHNIQPPQEIAFDGTRFVCHRCWVRIESTVNAPPPAQPLPAPASIVVPGLTRAANTSRRCMIANCNNQQLGVMSNVIKVHLVSYYNLYIPARARICQQHISSLSIEELSKQIVHDQNEITGDNVQDIINIFVRDRERRSNLDFENIDEISENDLKFWTGLNHENFNILLNAVPSLQEQSSTPKQDLGVYLCKIRNGEPNTRIGTIFGFSKDTVARKIRRARSCLMTDFVPLHMGFNHITRDEVVRRNRLLPQHIFGSEEDPKAIIILDGTYLFVEKSSNFLFQRQSYSLHKYRNLVKPFMIVCADGHIIDITGPYAATTTDADILRQLLTNDDTWQDFFQENDVLVLDRGFRDGVPVAEEYGFQVHVPPSTVRGERQLSTEASNKSRLVTICRWVVEAINGRLKRDFKMFRHRTFNRDLPHIFDDFKIAGAIINCFQEPFHDSQYTEGFIETITRNMQKPNLLAGFVEQNNLNQRRVAFMRLDANSEEVSDFPRLTYEDLIMISIGTYHPRIARSYCSEHINETDVYLIEVYRHPERINIDVNDVENNVLLRCRIQSRHVRRKEYHTYVLYNRQIEGRNAVVEYCCSCIHGRRTLGVCAHVMSVIYYLGWTRNQPQEMNHPADFLNHVLVRDLENE